jgi:hypothetical protein
LPLQVGMNWNENDYIILQASSCEKAVPHPVNFSITPESLQNVKDKGHIPRFLVTGHLDSTVCCVTKPFTGEVQVLMVIH